MSHYISKTVDWQSQLACVTLLVGALDSLDSGTIVVVIILMVRLATSWPARWIRRRVVVDHVHLLHMFSCWYVGFRSWRQQWLQQLHRGTNKHRQFTNHCNIACFSKKYVIFALLTWYCHKLQHIPKNRNKWTDNHCGYPNLGQIWVTGNESGP